MCWSCTRSYEDFHSSASSDWLGVSFTCRVPRKYFCSTCSSAWIYVHICLGMSARMCGCVCVHALLHACRVCVLCVCMCTCQCFLVHFSKEATPAKCTVLVHPAMVTGMTATTWLMHTAELFNCTASGNMTYISSSLQPDFNNTHTLYVKSCKG